MTYRTEAKRILRDMEAVESMAAPGSHEHGVYMRAALESKWHSIKAILMHVDGEQGDATTKDEK